MIGARVRRVVSGSDRELLGAFLYGAGLADGNSHIHSDLPLYIGSLSAACLVLSSLNAGQLCISL